jgi:penicillin V acylase-like amidase (Ntn superfamily)
MKRLTAFEILPVAAIILVTLLFFFGNAEACTRMFWNTNGKAMLVGRNLDLGQNEQPIFYVFPKGLARTGGTFNNALAWTSDYGSLMVTGLNNRNVSAEGINTAGLAFHSLYLHETYYEKRDQRPGVGHLTYGIYLLGKAATVLEALELFYQTQVVPDPNYSDLPQHFALEDASGDAAVIEFVGGKMYIYHGANFNILTNDPPLPGMPDLMQYTWFGGNLPLPGDNASSARFVRASAFVGALNSPTPPLGTPLPIILFSAIRALSEPWNSYQLYENPAVFMACWPTLWTIVSDLTNKAVYFSHNLARNNFWIDMNKLNFNEGAPMKSLNAQLTDLIGEVSGRFAPAPLAPATSLLLD